MKVVPYLLSLYVLTKPFYLWSSGLPQISDFILLIAFIIVIVTTDKKMIRQSIHENKFFFFFLAFVVAINVLYSIYYSDGDFLLHMLYYIFDAIGIITFVVMMRREERTKVLLCNSFKIALLIQCLILFLQIGRYYDPTRYMGTFNDPNQFAYYCFLSFGFIYLLDLKRRKKADFIFLILSMLLIYKSASTGMLVGMGIFVILYLIPLIKKMFANAKRYALPVFFVVVCAIAVLAVSSTFDGGFSIKNIFDNPVATRIHSKLNKVEGRGDMTIWEERGYDRFYYYPYYSIFGFGESAYWRLEKTRHQNELHATIPSILFCYGIAPTVFVLIWFYRKLRGQHWGTMCIYLALLLESFTLINSRQVLFWVIFAMAPYLINNKQKKEELSKCRELK